MLYEPQIRSLQFSFNSNFKTSERTIEDSINLIKLKLINNIQQRKFISTLISLDEEEWFVLDRFMKKYHYNK